MVSGFNTGIYANAASAVGLFNSSLSIIANGDVNSANGTGIYSFSFLGTYHTYIRAHNVTAKLNAIKSKNWSNQNPTSIITTGIVTSAEASGIYAYNSSSNPSTTYITVQTDSVVSGATSAIYIQSQSGSTSQTEIVNNGILKNLSNQSNSAAILAGSYTNNITITNNNQITGSIRIQNNATNTFINNSIWNAAGGNNLFGNGVNNVLTNNATINAVQNNANAPITTAFYGLSTLNNSGTINLQNNQIGNKLIITGDLVGAGTGKILMNTTLNGDNSPTDSIILTSGIASGKTRLFFNNIGETAAPTTGDGILVVSAVGASTTDDAFVLGKRVGSGLYEYELVKGGTSQPPGFLAAAPGLNQSWYLRSSSALRNEIPVGLALGSLSQQFGLTMLDTLDDRVGSKVLDQKGLDRGGAWIRIIGEKGKHTPSVSHFTRYGPNYHWDMGGLQLGYDLLRLTHANQSSDIVGVDVAFSQLNASIMNGTNTSKAGNALLQGYTYGAYWTHYSHYGWYTDAVFQGIDFNKLQLTSVNKEQFGSEAAGYLGSLEAGWNFNFIKNLILTPEAQILYQQINLKSFADSFSLYKYPNIDATFGRIGARLSKNWVFENNMAQELSLWGRVNLWHDFNPQSYLTIFTLSGQNPVDLEYGFVQNWTEFSLGLSGQLQNGFTLFASGNYGTLFSGIEGNIWGGRIGIKYVH